MTPPAHYLGVCAIFRREAPFLREWLAFHQCIGVERFILYDNGREPDDHLAVAPWVKTGAVTLIDWPLAFDKQATTNAYLHCLQNFGKQFRWIAFLDIDEFLFSPTHATVAKVLHSYEDFASVVVRWRCYGSSGHRQLPPNGVLRNLTWRAPSGWCRNRKVKSIVDPARTIHPIGPHLFRHSAGAHAVGEDKIPVRIRQRPAWFRHLRPYHRLLGPASQWIDPYSVYEAEGPERSAKRLRINHYPVRSREGFEMKHDLVGHRARHQITDYFAFHDRNEVLDPILHRYLDATNDLARTFDLDSIR